MELLQKEIEQDIIKITQELKKNTNKKRFDTMTSIIESIELQAYYLGIEPNYPPELLYEASKYNLSGQVKKMDKIFRDNWEKNKAYNQLLAKKLNRFAHEYGYFTYGYYYNEKLSKEDTIDLASGFFKKYDEDIYKHFKSLLDSNRIVLTDKELPTSKGYTIEGHGFIRPYIFIEQGNNTYDFPVLIHEIIHSYLDKYNAMVSESETDKSFLNNMAEVYSVFIERLGIDYLKSINYNKKDTSVLEREINDCAIDYFRQFNWMVKKTLDKKDENVNEEYYLIEAYTYALMLSTHFYDMYLKDPNKAKENITNFMMDTRIHDRAHLLNNYGLNDRELLKTDVLKRYIHK